MIDKYVEDIRSSLENKQYYAALSLALTLPDICGSVEFPNKKIHVKYIGWYDRYIGESLKNETPEIRCGKAYLSGEIVYNLRNLFLHSGQANIEPKKIKDNSNKIDKFILYVSEETHIDECTLNGKIDDTTFKVILVDVKYLCRLICDGAMNYYSENVDKFTFVSKIYACNTPEDLGISLRKALDEICEDYLRKSHERNHPRHLRCR